MCSVVRSSGAPPALRPSTAVAVPAVVVHRVRDRGAARGGHPQRRLRDRSRARAEFDRVAAAAEGGDDGLRRADPMPRVRRPCGEFGAGVTFQHQQAAPRRGCGGIDGEFPLSLGQFIQRVDVGRVLVAAESERRGLHRLRQHLGVASRAIGRDQRHLPAAVATVQQREAQRAGFDRDPRLPPEPPGFRGGEFDRQHGAARNDRGRGRRRRLHGGEVGRRTGELLRNQGFGGVRARRSQQQAHHHGDGVARLHVHPSPGMALAGDGGVSGTAPPRRTDVPGRTPGSDPNARSISIRVAAALRRGR